jgi:succinate-semialdehyde dehydrogenase / glutarate-semialdehyde dehydrogenase
VDFRQERNGCQGILYSHLVPVPYQTLLYANNTICFSMKKFQSINPFNQAVIAEHPLHDNRAIQHKIETATTAYKTWRKESFSSRATRMYQVAEHLLRHQEAYARTLTVEMGKVITEAKAEVEKSALACRYFAEHSETLLADTIVKTEATRSYVSYHPTGAVLGIMPWNFPFWQVFRFAVPTIMSGNVALLKHAPNVCSTALAIESIFLEAGFPEGVFQSLIIDVDKVEEIIEHDIVQAVTLTGSELAGAQVASLAGKYIKKTVLELGGSDAFIVLEDADLEKAAKTGVQSRMQNAGQSCIAAKRFIVHEKVKEEFLDRFTKNVSHLVQDDPLKESTTVGPMARLDLAEKLEKQLKASVAAGALLVMGGTRIDCKFSPAILDNVTPGMAAFEEETFGPMAAILTVKDEQEAVAMANRSRYGLGASLWTKDLDKAARLARDVESGSVYVNTIMRSDVRLPFGGVKKSGYGRELAEQGIKEFLNIKTISMESGG